MQRSKLHSIALLCFALSVLTGCLSAQDQNSSAQLLPVRYAFMTIKTDGYTSAANVWHSEPLLRMEVLGGRKSNTMLVNYQTGQATVLVPSEAKYQHFMLQQLDQSVPHFFDPAIRLDKIKVGEEAIGKTSADIYQTTSTGRTGRIHHGKLWLSSKYPDFPLKWVASDRDIVVTWDSLEHQSRPSSWFEIPPHYQNLAD